jgi:hypothetical protein
MGVPLLRRVLPVVAAAALVLVPSSAWAAPAQGPVNHYGYAGQFAMVDAQLPGGRTVNATLTQYYGTNHSETSGFLSLSVQQPCDVASTGRQCLPGASGYAELTGDQVEFDRGLRGASVEDVPLTLTTPAYYSWSNTVAGGSLSNAGQPPLGMPPFPPALGEPTGPVLVPGTSEDVTVSLEFTGTGSIDRSAQHTLADYCGMDSTGCQSTHVGAARTAEVTITLARASGETTTAASSTGLLTYDQSVDNATPAGAH